MTELAIEFGLGPLFLHTGWGAILGDRTSITPLPGLSGRVHPVSRMRMGACVTTCVIDICVAV